MTDGEVVCAGCAFIAAVCAGVAAGILITGDFAREFDIGRVESDVSVLQVWMERLFDLVLERCKP